MFPELETSRYFLKEITDEDQAFIFKGLGDKQVILYYGVSYESLEATASQIQFYKKIWSEKSGCWWKIVDKQTMEAAGACGMNYYNKQHQKAEIGYWLLPGSWKKGIMKEVLPVMIDHLFNAWQLHRLESVIEEGNIASCRLAERTGFILEGKLRECEIKNGKRISLLLYSLLANDPR